ncbi:MAG: hypothetical protein HC855_08260 [Rhizobiales bacterium]|nr:hypothetical protein [Hyphomicrobiales bacterium]
MRPLALAFTSAFLATSALTVPALAQDRPPVVTAILQSFETQLKGSASIGNIADDGSGNITVTNMSFDAPASGTEPAIKFTVGEMALNGVSDKGSGLFEISNATFKGMKVDVSDPSGATMPVSVAIDVPEGRTEGWYVLALGDQPSALDQFRASMSVARKTEFGKMTMTVNGVTVTADGYSATWDGDPNTGSGMFDARFSNLVIPESAIAMLDTAGQLKQLGYTDIRIDLSGKGKLDVTPEALSFDMSGAYDMKDMGSLQFSAAAANVPMAAVGELQSASKAGREPDFNAMMPQLMGVTLSSVKLRFEDASITKRVLPMIAAMQGMDEATMVASAGAMAQLGLAQLKNQAFTDQTVAAINAFLKDPRSLTVSLKPAAPVTVQEMMGFSPQDPGAAITQLGVSVSAND